jgi:hypothetical protein
VLTVVPQEVVGLRSFRQRLGWLRGLHYRGSLDVVHLHYSLSVQSPNCFPLPTSRRDRRGTVGREPSNSTGGTLTRVRVSCAGCCAGTMQLEMGSAPSRLTVAASGRKLRLAVLSNQNVRVDGGYDVFGETPKTARETRALPSSNCIVRAEGGTPNEVRDGRSFAWAVKFSFELRLWTHKVTPCLFSVTS